MTEVFWNRLNQLLTGYNFGTIPQDENALCDLVRMLLEEDQRKERLLKVYRSDFDNYKKGIELKFKTFEMFLFYLKESLVIPYNVTLTHRERDGLNTLLSAKIAQFIENQIPINDDGF